LTGGGFEVSLTPLPTTNVLTNVSILQSKPSESGNGWFVRGVIRYAEFADTDIFTLNIYAVCGTVEQQVNP